MLPIAFLQAAESMPVLIQCKDGDAFNGYLVAVDDGMNISLRNVIRTSKNGKMFWRMPLCFVKGYNIKFLRLSNKALDILDAGGNLPVAERGRERGPVRDTWSRGGARGSRSGPAKGELSGRLMFLTRPVQSDRGGGRGSRGASGRGRGGVVSGRSN